MKQLFHKGLAMLLAVTVVFSTMSFTVDMHFCGDMLVDMALFKKAKSCGMEQMLPAATGCSILKKNCCSDKQMVIDGQDELKLTADQPSPIQKQMAIAWAYAYTILFSDTDTRADAFQRYKPPRVVRQIYKIDESYLI